MPPDDKPITLENIQAGDTAYMSIGHYGTLHKLTVTKVTATQIVCSDGERYKRTNGYRIGDHSRWSTPTLSPATPEIEAEYQRQQNLSRLKAINWNEQSDETLAAIVALLPQKEGA